MLYEDHLCLGVSTNNVEEVIRTCFQRIEGRELGRLPKSTFAKYMLHEARALAQIQVAQELLDGWDTDSRTLHSDGTSKHGRSFVTYDVVKESGEGLLLGLREIASGDSTTQLNVLERLLSDVVNMFQHGAVDVVCDGD